MKKKIPDHGYPATYYLCSNRADGMHDPDDDGPDQDPPRCTDRQQAIDCLSGAPDYHQEGVVAVYKLVEIIEVRQRRTVTSHPIRETKTGAGK